MFKIIGNTCGDVEAIKLENSQFFGITFGNHVDSAFSLVIDAKFREFFGITCGDPKEGDWPTEMRRWRGCFFLSGRLGKRGLPRCGTKKMRFLRKRFSVAERKGFEPSIPF